MNYNELLNHHLPEELPSGYSATQLTGDASTRSYFRIRDTDDSTVMLMRMPEPFDTDDFPYLKNYDLFRYMGIPLAAILAMKPNQGFVLLQDLGDDTFYELYNGWNQPEQFLFLFKALEYQSLIERAKPENSISFDASKFEWELDYFLRNFLVGLRGTVLSENEKSELQEHFKKLASELAARPLYFCHRDYHSRNFMVHQDCVYVIDFQDARYGPATYDLASLCYDSYLQHPPELIHTLEQAFFMRHPDQETQRFEYPRMCLQRNLKALGTFGYQTTVLGRTFYLQFVEPTLEYVKQHFLRLPEYSDLSTILSRHLPEIRH